jgi:hypothetical protein
LNLGFSNMTAKWPLMDRFWVPELAKQALLLVGQYWRLEMRFAAAHESVSWHEKGLPPCPQFGR